MRANIGIGLPSNLSPTLTQRALAILRTYGTDAHLWLPGVGVVNGITAGNFSDTAGTTAAIVDSTAGVGRVNDTGGGTINATQGTTAAKPILRQSSGRYSWQFDGTDDRLQLSAAPWGNVTDTGTFIVSQLSRPSGTTNSVLFGLGNSGSTTPVFWVSDNNGLNGRTQLLLRGNSTPVDQTFDDTTAQTRVLAARNQGGTVVLRQNGVTRLSFGSSGIGTGDLNTGRIGNIGRTTESSFFSGNIGPVIAIKGTVSDADLLTLEKWVGSLSGVTI